ncbi:mismatch repair protein MutS-like ATPase [Clostridium pasteurianum DSM 525 = ATCC 6013]|uniref:DNA mismatch repair protein MutS domain protein n=1 Tax=Clostridium pasteurianum DSM 525 = ATCC 6013 TaxID=1262449 RepID=A0A0H3J9G5_CLOPA|nr:Mismatch repair protein MutS-like ATPase [Clostridium pasteurianum]AJA49982.1 mismatch repair protein MutS-like ATPase [Clostridium pasteurianum DSM 525 = ATCC 6013]AJA53970.1 mismatch repair protein MutS-like ATPase [Clostridium pasteurianum DSM 525 = ATCC 6013]AOZ77115.1 DNA mismatch repair protein MutS [Clostridium pasteurianum DSM 525 = ATCC 6013]AOZ80912.1 DNA mismatch repair protein MutS [Clostridium pasteurianum]ELP59306.1 Mismatch repair protein MutS-like ATPase [Clostridium pasteur
MDEQVANFFTNIFLIVTIFIGAVLITQGIRINYIYLVGLLPLIFIVFMVFYIRKKLILEGLYKTFIKEWGKDVERKRDFKSIRSIFDYIRYENDNEFYLDDQTWSDLTMDEVYKLIDRTLTSPGEEALYKILRTPLFKEQDLKDRNEIINLMQNDKKFREELGMYLLKLNRKKINDIPDLLWNDINADIRLRPICIVMAIVPVASIVFFLITKNLNAIFITFIALCVNYIIHNKIKKRITKYVSCIGYLNNIIVAGNDISKISCEKFKSYKDLLGELSRRVFSITKRSAGVGRIEGIDQTGIAEILYVILLFEENQFFSCINLIKKYQEDLKRLYVIIGEIDAMLSIAAYRDGLKFYSHPNFTDDTKYLEAEELIHPLIDNAVSNSINISDKGIILTGSNMSGKSTFLRTIGVNAVLAQTIYITTSSYYKASFFKIMTSISPEDNIMGGKSYYFREAEALLRIIEESGKDYPLLCIIDEIFRGTNPVERVNASIEILKYLERHNALAVVATHDIELTDMLMDKYNLFYFTEDIDKDGMVFDYKLKPGVCRTRNAVKLLKFLNYPDEIIENTNRRIEGILKCDKE